MYNIAVRGHPGPQFFCKKVIKKFANQKIKSTFASPFEKGGLQKFFKTNFLKKVANKFADSKNVRIFAVPLVKNGGAHQPTRLVFLAPKLKRVH